MSDYALRLLLVLPLICGLIIASLWLARRMQAGRLLPGGGARIANVVETQTLAPGLRLAVVEFAGRRVLLGLDRQGMKTLASDDRGPA